MEVILYSNDNEGEDEIHLLFFFSFF